MQVFNPRDAADMADRLNDSYVDALSAVNPFMELGLLPGLKSELPKFITTTKAYNYGTSSVDNMKEFTAEVLEFWEMKHKEFPTWAKAARIAFSMTPNSASCERVFSLLAHFYGDARDVALADQIEASLMIAYNKRAAA